MNENLLLAIITTVALVLACAVLPTPTPTPEPTATWTPLPPVPTATSTQTPTPVVLVVTATPTATPSTSELVGNLYEVKDPAYFFGKIVREHGKVPALIDESGLWVESGTKFYVFFYVDGQWRMGTWTVVEGEWRRLGTETIQPTPAPSATPGAGREARVSGG